MPKNAEGRLEEANYLALLKMMFIKLKNILENIDLGRLESWKHV